MIGCYFSLDRMKQGTHLQVWFEFASTYSYPAVIRVEQLASLHGVPLNWEPFLLGPIFKSQGWSDSPFNIYPVKGHYMWRDLERICGELAIPFRRPSVFPRNGLLAARVCAQFKASVWLPAFIKAVYSANFAHDLDISQASVLAECLQQSGHEPRAILEQANSPAAKNALRNQTDRAITLGIFGAPTFVSAAELFWGNDRLDAAISWSKRGANTA